MARVNTQIVLAARPVGQPDLSHFALRETPMPQPEPGEVLLETLYLSLDPYMRARMYDGPNYAAPVAVGGVMVGQTVSRVIASNDPGTAVGTIVLSPHGWQSHATARAGSVTPLDLGALPPSTALHVMGLTGLTAYGGMMRHGRMAPGETLVVSAAAGAVGSVAAQIGKAHGLRVVGLAGGAEKCRYLTDALGLDGAVDHRAPDRRAALARACPDGIDIYYDNVGGDLAADILPLLNRHGRYLVCGTIGTNRDLAAPAGVDHLPDMLARVLTRQLTVQGFIFDEFADLRPAFRRDMQGWIGSGQMRWREDVVDGLAAAPAAFLGLFTGRNQGKLLVHLAD